MRLHQWFLTRGVRALPNVTPVLILRRYMWLGLVPAEIEAGVKFLEILQTEFEPAYKYSWVLLGKLFSRDAKQGRNEGGKGGTIPGRQFTMGAPNYCGSCL